MTPFSGAYGRYKENRAGLGTTAVFISEARGKYNIRSKTRNISNKIIRPYSITVKLGTTTHHHLVKTKVPDTKKTTTHHKHPSIFVIFYVKFGKFSF